MARQHRLSSCCLLLATLLAAGALADAASAHGARFARIPRRAAVQKPPKPKPLPRPEPKPEPSPRPLPRPNPKQPSPTKSESSAVKVGPWPYWGVRGGTTWDISKSSKPHHLKSITVRSTNIYGGRINGFSFVYVNVKGQSIRVGTWGSSTKGYNYTITMRQGEYVNQVSGTFDGIGVTSLMFVTNTRVEYGTYGYPSGRAFSVPLQQGNGHALSFFGSSGDSLVALGTYVAPRA